MATRIKMWKKVTGWFLLVTFSLVITVGQAETGFAAFDHSVGLSNEPAEITAPQDFHYSSHVLFKVKYVDWTCAEIVRDLPDIILRNSLTIWTTDYLRNPFYRLLNINAP
jgi:hypothetical protein